mmetsp:Transcript_37058/g.44800  ORF Transcript_37058/g.44800 Transcript_37058/m.44800 type:complete len:351 (-) Transcript_37058:231-1283(-)|eukprot:CAMPEP_0197847786 /NCGR_PEP_ID=MMETSP1438-20131217/7099_1 /TAXON_ID=1461541 /ORGANISM="Pterosperma sp., Strain CCMP1384" /LENGTH=350 /DNA_ID=CAMNT_0043459809 /DNA_START=125 /DNA_END=1177 /DNA_ORIENTATION=+
MVKSKDLRQRTATGAGPELGLVDQAKMEYARYTKLISAASAKAPEKYAPYIEKAAPVGAGIVVFLKTVIPLYVKLFQRLYDLYNQLPYDLMVAVYGFALCFFGGQYATLIAAVETFRIAGWDPTKAAIMELLEEHKAIAAANKDDNDKDDDGNGVKDVDELEADKLLMRKTVMILKSANPDKVNSALSGIYMGLMGVVAALKVKFAKTVMLGVSLSNALKAPVNRFIVPIVKKTVDEDYHKWIPSVVGYVCKFIAISIVWWLQRVISAFHSAIKGGLMCARHTIAFSNSKGYTKIDCDNSYVDEIAGWGLAMLGMYLQVIYGFTTPFPLNIIFLPLDAVEYMITWMVTSD